MEVTPATSLVPGISGYLRTIAINSCSYIKRLIIEDSKKDSCSVTIVIMETATVHVAKLFLCTCMTDII